MTWKGTLGPYGNFTEFEPFVQQGGEGLAVDLEGNVYLAAGQIYVYNPAGRLVDTIETPAADSTRVRREGRADVVHCRTQLAVRRADAGTRALTPAVDPAFTGLR